MTEGIYAWSRNPQNVGWIAAQFGIVILGRSALGLVTSTVFAVIFLVYVRYEERHLQSIFGAPFLAYKQRSHRLFGPPKTVRRKVQQHQSRPSSEQRKVQQHQSRPSPEQLGNSPSRRHKVSPMSAQRSLN